MKNSGRHARRAFIPSLARLESRRLLAATAVSLGQDGHDLVGPNASVGPDGVQDLHIQLSGLNIGGLVSLQSIDISGPSGFEWSYGPNLAGTARAEFFQTNAVTGTGDLYINPTVDSNTTGNLVAPGSSTGTPVSLKNGDLLNLTITYSGSSNPPPPETINNVPVSNLTYPTSQPYVPTIVSNAFQVQRLGQDNTAPSSWERGWVHLVLTGFQGGSFQGLGLTQAQLFGAHWVLNDTGGVSWDNYSGNGSGPDGHWIDVYPRSDGSTVDLYFDPTCDESKNPDGTPLLDGMTLRVDHLPGTLNEYVTAFTGAAWDPSLRAIPRNGRSDTLSPVDAVAATQLEQDLANNDPSTEVDTINVPAGMTIDVAHPLGITHSVIINGNGASLVFNQGANDPAWPATASGALYVSSSYPPGGLSVDLEDFTVRFNLAGPLRWATTQANPLGTFLYDPESYNANYAVINTTFNNNSRTVVFLTLNGMTVDGAPAIDPARPGPGVSYQTYVGEEAMNLIDASNGSGSIKRSFFQGGAIHLAGGPWTVQDNHHYGSYDRTFDAGAFSVDHPHDVLIDGNSITQSFSTGYTFRPVNFGGGTGYNDRVTNNTFAGNVGEREVNEVTYTYGSPPYDGKDANAPEGIMTETNNILFEGTPAAVSPDGRVLVLPMVGPNVAARQPVAEGTGAGEIVSMLSVANPNVGKWYRIGQQLSTSPLMFLMQDPLPAGSYAISIVSGYVDEKFDGNTLDLSGSVSGGISLLGADFGAEVNNNTIIGSFDPIAINAYYTNPTDLNGLPFALPGSWTRDPVLDLTVEGNTIINSGGGINLQVSHEGVTTDVGRRYLTATVEHNAFKYTTNFTNNWNSIFPTSYFPDDNQHPSNSPSDDPTPPTVTIGTGFIDRQVSNARRPSRIEPVFYRIPPKTVGFSIRSVHYLPDDQ